MTGIGSKIAKIVAKRLILFVLLPACAGAQIRQEVPVPGGTAVVAKVVGLERASQRSRFMLEVVRALYDQPAGVDAAADRTLESLYDYLDTVTEVELAIQNMSGELSLRNLSEEHTREQLSNVLELLGLELTKRKGVYRAAIEKGRGATARREFLASVGVDPSSIAGMLNAGSAASIEIPYETVPLPLPPPVWAEVVFGGPIKKRALFRSIMGDRKAALLYHGLSAVDDETLRYLAAHPDLLRRLYRDHAAIFAFFGRSVRVQDDVFQIPGDARARSLWTDLVGERLDEPGPFIRRLLGRNRGRLAFFYDTVIHLDTPHRGFALGLAVTDVRERRDRFQELYDNFAATDELVNLEDTPFKRRPFDAALLLREVAVTAEGHLDAPNWYGLWREAYAGSDLPRDPVQQLRKLDPSDPVDSAWLVARICRQMPRLRRQRFEMFLFAQRVFSKATLAEAPNILVALRGFVRHRALMLTLERMGLNSPSLYAAAAKRAAELSDIEDERRAVAALAQFQAALALIERARFRGTLDVDRARRLVRSLVGLELHEEHYFGAVARWMDQIVIPLFRSLAELDLETSADDILMLALAGPSWADAQLMFWEGMSYQLSFRDAEYRRLIALREAQGGNDLASVLEFGRLVERIGSARSLELIGAYARDLAGWTARLHAVEEAGVEHAPEPMDLDQSIREPASRLLNLTRAEDLRNVDDISEPLVKLTDELLADVLRSYVYAIHLGHVDGPILITEKLARRHDFGVRQRSGDQRKQTPWQLASEISRADMPWHVRGSLLAMDLGLSRLRLRRLEGMPPREAPTMSVTDRQTFSQSVALMNPLELRDEDRDLLAATIERGRARVGDIVSRPENADAVARDARLSAWRRYVLPWAIVNEPEDVALYFSMMELFWLGLGAAPETQERRLGVWGSTAFPSTGCYCLRFPTPGPWEDFAGRKAHGQLAARMPDLNLLIAERLSEWKLPAALAPSILSYLVLDFVERAQPTYQDDWQTVARHVFAIPAERIQDYVSSVAASDGLARVAAADEHGAS